MPDDVKLTLDRQLSAEIVGAYLRNHQVPAEQLGALISAVHQTFSGLGTPAAEATSERNPAVPIRRSVHRDYVVCLECGWRGQMLRRHLTMGHGLTIDEYRARWNLKPDHPVTAPGYSERRSTMAKQLGLGRTRGASAGTMAMPATETQTETPPDRKRRARPRSTVASA